MEALRLVVNADDAGMDRCCDEVILRCATQGVLTSASIIAGGPHADAFCRLAPDAGLGLGLHINFSEGSALAGAARGLTDPSGRFVGKQEIWRRLLAGEVPEDAIQRELDAQWCWLKERAEIDHVDGHNHVHVLPQVRRSVALLPTGLFRRVPRECDCLEEDLPELPRDLVIHAPSVAAEARHVDGFFGFRFSRHPSLEVFIEGLARCRGVSAEFMVHLGPWRQGSRFTASPARRCEAQVLLSPSMRRALEERGAVLARFGDLS